MNKLEIINVALGRLGESPIQSLDEGSVASNSARTFYDSSRRAVLRSYLWNFAVTITRLARLSDVPVDFKYGYVLPSDCLRVIRIKQERIPDGVAFREPCFTLRGGNLYTNDEVVQLEYIRDVEDTTLFDDKFIEALSFKLASDLAMPIKASTELMANYANMYQSLVQEAATATASEVRDELPENPYLDARFF